MAVGEWDQRQLCSDGACVGVIGPDGTCKVCGRAAANWGDERKRGLIDPPGDDADEDDELAARAEAHDEAKALADDEDDELDDDEDEDDGIDDLDDDDDDDEDDDDDGDGALDGEGRSSGIISTSSSSSSSSSSRLGVSPPEWSNRDLCPDGACIGVIGLDGRCKVCGRRASGTSPSTASGTADSGFAVVTTDGAVETTDDAVQTVASTITTDAPDGAAEPGDADDPKVAGAGLAPDPAADDPKAPIR